MDVIALENIRLYAYHGCLEEETKIGSQYQVDLKVWADLSKSAKSDSLKDTVDYVLLCKIVKQQMQIRSQLLEQVAERILSTISKKVPAAMKAKICVSKINPPINGDVEKVSVVMKREFRSIRKSKPQKS